MPLQLPNVCKLTWLEAVIAGLAVNAHLIKDPGFVLDRDTTLADLHAAGVEADYDGYVDQPAVGWTVPALNLDLGAQSQADVLLWVKDPGIITNTIFGYWLDDGVATLWGVEMFLFAQPMLVAGDAFTLRPTFTEKSEFNN